MSAFSQLAAKLASRPGVTNPDALAASIGRKKLQHQGMSASQASHTMAQAAANKESVQAVLRKRRSGK